jgi:S1-C subfamily serine protease
MPTVPFGSAFVKVSGELIVMETAAVAMALRLSFTWTVKFEVPFAVGIPEISPVLGEMLRPAGSVPAETLHVYGVDPPAATSEVE